MPPKKKRPPPINCERIEGERFHAQNDDVFRYNWWEVFCFPYILCARFWDCCVSLCAGTNQCLVYWMMIQWLVCKITKITTPDPIIFPYYFYMFCQVILLTLVFVLIWIWLGKSVVIPYFKAVGEAVMFTKDEEVKNTTKLSFRKYCFKKSEIFDTELDNSAFFLYPYSPINLIAIVIDLYVVDIYF